MHAALSQTAQPSQFVKHNRSNNVICTALTRSRATFGPATVATAASYTALTPRRIVCCQASTADAQLQLPSAESYVSTAGPHELLFWQWRGAGKRQTHNIAYVTHGSGPIPVVLVHGMGACHEHYNRLLAELDTRQYTAYALDLLGFGDSDKPHPNVESSGPRGHLYNYDTWSQQIQEFVEEVVGLPAVLVGNSAGGLAALKAAVAAPAMTRGLMLLDCSMRNMHEANQPAFLHPFIAALQWVLLSTPVGRLLVQVTFD